MTQYDLHNATGTRPTLTPAALKTRWRFPFGPLTFRRPARLTRGPRPGSRARAVSGVALVAGRPPPANQTNARLDQRCGSDDERTDSNLLLSKSVHVSLLDGLVVAVTHQKELS
ncbi:hypothetical protein EVAR_76013_1 [Eumeta japonica]|uniref:Uncharacterized protein n=1 Tax=Eumeta variegata TaxID=151549 RepID=A0A4C1UAF7_EUMVA|nr:hypothetical protein EVAR_76013_1 [Eumeta japonica]